MTANPISFWFHCAAVVLRRELRMNFRSPSWIIVGLLQPVLYLVLFAPLLRPLAGTVGTDDIYAFFIPGLLVQMGVIGLLSVGFGVLADRRFGVMDTQRVTPAPRSALLLGRVARDVLALLFQAVVLLALGAFMGMHAPLAGVLVGLVICVVLGTATAAASYALALTLGSEMTMAPVVNGLMLPILLLSGILLPTDLGPGWLQVVGRIMPTHRVVEGLRAAFAGEVASADTLSAVVIVVLLAVAGIRWGTRTVARRSA